MMSVTVMNRPKLSACSVPPKLVAFRPHSSTRPGEREPEADEAERANRHPLVLRAERLGDHRGDGRQRDADDGNDGGERGLEHQRSPTSETAAVVAALAA